MPQLSDSQLLKILIIGNSGVGKSCMLMRYVENNFTTAFYNTIGVDFVRVHSCRK
jgi:GTPase SAR1 family protein